MHLEHPSLQPALAPTPSTLGTALTLDLVSSCNPLKKCDATPECDQEGLVASCLSVLLGQESLLLPLSLIHVVQTSWNAAPSATCCPDSSVHVHVSLPLSTTGIPLQDFKETSLFSESLYISASKTWKKSNVFLKVPLCLAGSGQKLHGWLNAGEMSTSNRARAWCILPACLSHASSLPGSCQLILWVLYAIFPLHWCTKSLSISAVLFFFFSHPPYTVLCFKSASSTVIS